MVKLLPGPQGEPLDPLQIIRNHPEAAMFIAALPFIYATHGLGFIVKLLVVMGAGLAWAVAIGTREYSGKPLLAFFIFLIFWTLFWT